MRASQACISFIKGFEKLRLVGYLPTPDDVPTIGWGHTGPGVRVGMICTEAQAEAWFSADVAIREVAIGSFVRAQLTQGQFDALVSLIFNIGVSAFKTSTLLRKLNANDYAGAAAEFPKWNKQKGKELDVLTRRRAAEVVMFNG